VINKDASIFLFITPHSALIIHESSMPTYEYKCDACGHAFEKFQPITSDPVKKCPVCGKNKVRRLISAGGGLIFKGSGFYITDYRDKGYGDSAKADTADGGAPKTETTAGGDKSPPADPAKPAESKPAESKPAASSDSKPAASKSDSGSKSESKPSKSAKKK
jgi:putative FmdB family regulatory protein